jgi:hypothetical protein
MARETRKKFEARFAAQGAELAQTYAELNKYVVKVRDMNALHTRKDAKIRHLETLLTAVKILVRGMDHE